MIFNHMHRKSPTTIANLAAQIKKAAAKSPQKIKERIDEADDQLLEEIRNF